MALWSGLGQAATVAQLVGADAAGLISAILQAVRTARRNRKECRLLARRVMMVGDLLQLLQDTETTRRAEVRRALDGLGGALRQAYDLVESCQEGSAVYGFIMAGRQAEQFRDVQGEIDSYLLVFPVVSHIDITRRLDRIYNILLPPGSQQVSEEMPGSPTSRLEPDARNQENALEHIQVERNQTITELFGVGQDEGADPGVLQMALEKFLTNKAQGHQEGVEELSTRDQRFKWLCWWPGMEPGLKHIGDQEECAVLDLLKAATNNFSSDNELGRGGWATVYKGQICNGLEVAIKRYHSNGQVLEDYRTECHVVTKLQHPNIIKLLGHSNGGGKRILVYEYMPSGSLDKFIFGMCTFMFPFWSISHIVFFYLMSVMVAYLGRGVSLDWLSRFQIIEGIVQGLLYLHTHTVPIVHRDVKPSNILLDSDMNAKICDFDIAIMLSPGQQDDAALVVGTFGYLAPEYHHQGILSTKVDVYAFGVTLLEIIAAKRSFDVGSRENGDLPSYAWDLWTTGRSVELLDPPLLNEHRTSEVLVMKCVQIALLCVQRDPADRPTMSDVFAMLTSENISLPDPVQPDFYQGEDTSEEMPYNGYASEATWSSADLTWPR